MQKDVETSNIIISIASGKGGVGKTNLSLNLGLALARRCPSTCLLDADMGVANAEVLLGESPEFSLADVLEGRQSLDQALFQAPEGLKLLSGGTALDSVPNLSFEKKHELAAVLKDLSFFELLLIDVGAGITAEVMNWLQAASIPIVVVTPEPTSLTDAYALIKLSHERGQNRPFYIWVNQARSAHHASSIFKRLSAATEKHLQVSLKFMGHIPQDQSVQQAVATQTPFVLSFPNSQAARAVDNTAAVMWDNRRKIRRGKDLQVVLDLSEPSSQDAQASEPQSHEPDLGQDHSEQDRPVQTGTLIGESLIQEGMITTEQLEKGLQTQNELREKPIGEILVSQGMVNPGDVSDALKRQKNWVNQKIGEILCAVGLLSQDQLEQALEEQQKDRSKRLGQVLVEMKFISEEQLALALALRFGLPYVDLSTYQVDPFASQQVAPETCKKYNIFPFEIHKNELRVAFPEPAITNAKEELQFITGLTVKEYIASQKSINDALDEYIAQETGEESEEFEDLMLSETDLDEIVQSDDDEYDITESSGKEETIIALVNHILKTGVKKKASDIHINPEPKKVNVDFRIDGKLHRELNLPKDRLSSLVARMKILSNMNIAERRLPQDGRAKIKVGNKGVDLRFSCMPTVFGESVVIRILDKDKGVMKLDDIGLYKQDVDLIRRTISKPYGMILITGPTGSGKSSTIYSCLQEPVFLGKNIITLEDPVEYEMPGVCQVQIRESIGFTFARGLRQILRHDPDVITVGEIRDSETAQIGIQAALTGHLLVSTLHTNSAAEVFVRLADMGIEPYLISASIIGTMSQRLIRRLCDKCKEPDPEAEIKLKAGQYGVMPQNGAQICKAVGCKACNSTGYKGRIMIYEYLTPNEDIKRAVLRSESSSTLKELAVKNGMMSLEHIALTKAEEGLTSIEEILPLAAE